MISILTSLLLLLIICTFPGILFTKQFFFFKKDEKFITTIFFSLGFWVVLPYFTSLINLPLDLSFFALIGAFIVVFVYQFYKDRFSLSIKNLNLYDWILIAVCLIYFLPFWLLQIPPGADSSMHGYVTMLVLHYNGVPSSFEPIIPYENFSSYSAGWSFLCAYITLFKESNLLAAFKIMTTLPYSLCVLALYFLLRQFYQKNIAVLGSTIPFLLIYVVQVSISWGGNTTVMSFAFCLFSLAILYKFFFQENVYLIVPACFSIAAIPLIHAIPAMVFIYVAGLGMLFFFLFQPDRIKETTKLGFMLVLVTTGLLLPFLSKLETESSPELITMIKDWQQTMTHHKYGDHLLENLWVTFDRMKNRISDMPFVLSMISITFLLIRKKWKIIVLSISLYALLFLLFINSNYWFLPMSELLYPERVAFFMLFCISLLWSEYLKESFEKPFFKIKGIPLLYIIIPVFSMLGIIQFHVKYLRNITSNPVSFNEGILESFTWIKEHISSDGLIQVSYMDSGMWIPAFTKRSIVGGHMHFIHYTENCEEKLLACKKNKYLFLTKKDLEFELPIIKEKELGKVVFKNSEVEIVSLP